MFSRWRLHRRIFHQSFRQAAIPTYHPVLIRSARKMLFSFLQDSTDYTSHFQMLVATVTDFLLKLIVIRFISSSILSMVYDYEPKAKDDPVVRIMQRYLELLVTGLEPGAFIIMEALPFRMSTCAVLVYSQTSITPLVLRLPTWFPGATFKRASVECHRAGHSVKEIAFQDVKERMVNQIAWSKDVK
jgi:hypothetical protein